MGKGLLHKHEDLSLSPAHPSKGWHGCQLGAGEWRQEDFQGFAGQLASQPNCLAAGSTEDSDSENKAEND